jgi:coproporphyrinogen III oxidase
VKSYKEDFTQFIHSLQDEICAALEQADGLATFKQDEWAREGGGGGKTRVITNGKVFEKGGVNTSVVHGILPESMMQYLKLDHNNFFACGLSLVLHPNNPFVPTVHANYRYFEVYDEQGAVVDQWFAGGSDLTPYYLFEEDAVHFHSTIQNVCNEFDPQFYYTYKHACDNYFYNAHRGEARGIGGAFFDYLRPTAEHGADFWFNFTTSMGKAFVSSYIPIVEKRKEQSFTEDHKYWQAIRRGRYVEFNLIHDKGTLFGLKTNGRIESILMSLPPVVRWDYDFTPAAGSAEEHLIQVLRSPKNWLSLSHTNH